MAAGRFGKPRTGEKSSAKKSCKFKYRVTMVVVHLAWIDLHLGCFIIVTTIAAKTAKKNFPYLSQPNQGARSPVPPCKLLPYKYFSLDEYVSYDYTKIKCTPITRLIPNSLGELLSYDYSSLGELF